MFRFNLEGHSSCRDSVSAEGKKEHSFFLIIVLAKKKKNLCCLGLFKRETRHLCWLIKQRKEIVCHYCVALLVSFRFSFGVSFFVCTHTFGEVGFH